MAIYKNTPPIVTSGLVLYADMANRNSYISGSLPVVNLNDKTTGSFDFTPLFSINNGGIVDFNGQILTFLTSSNFNTIQTNNSLTLSVWFKTPSTGSYRDVVGINKATGNNPFCIRFTDINSLFYDTFVGGTRYTPRINNTMPTNTWIQACATFGNNLITTYYNGQIVENRSTTGNITTFTSNQFGIGGSIGYGYYSGSISNFQLYNRVLSQAEVLQNYNATKTRFNLT